jgi:hypothetical protein
MPVIDPHNSQSARHKLVESVTRISCFKHASRSSKHFLDLFLHAVARVGIPHIKTIIVFVGAEAGVSLSNNLELRFNTI